MSTEDEQHVKSRNPENLQFWTKSPFQVPQIRVKFCLGSTGLTPMQQRKISKLIKKSRHMQLAL